MRPTAALLPQGQMEKDNLNQLSAAGLPVFDLNSESLARKKDWETTPLGKREDWPLSLRCLVNTCILPIPHCCAIFWGDELAVIHNLAFGKAQRGDADYQGRTARKWLSDEAVSCLEACVRGRTLKVDCSLFLEDAPDSDTEATMLLSTLLDDSGKRQGVLAQLIHSPIVERYMPVGEFEKSMGGQDKQASENPKNATRRKGSEKAHTGDDADVRQAIDGQSNKYVDSKQSELFRTFAELLPNGLAILDSEAEAIFVNDGFFKLTTNKTSNEFRAWPESIDPRDYDRVMNDYRKAFSTREELRCEFRCAGTGTMPEQEQWRLFLLRPLNEAPEAGFICAVVDITEIKQAQLTQEKAAAEAQERKEQQERFIDMVSHEIRNPLSAVLHLAEEVKEVARDIGSNHEDVKEQIADILDAADTILLCVSHQNVLVDDILSFSKLDSMMLSLVPREVRPKWDLPKAMKIFNSEFQAKNIKFRYAIDYSYEDFAVDHVIADLNRMNQVLVNLLTNAIKFTSRKQGHRDITVSLGASVERPTSYPPNVIFFSQSEDAFHIDSTMSSDWGSGPALYLMVAVRDTGIGISADNQAKLFERFRQATPKTSEKYGGSGLGLFISRKLCQLHGGDIGVSSKEGEGSTFGFFFKVRRSDGSSDSGRPPFGHRSSSDSNAESGPKTPRPGYSRTNSSLTGIKESESERPAAHSLTSHAGVDTADMTDTLKNPPTELRHEVHPEASGDERYRETAKVANKIMPRRDSVRRAIEEHLPEFQLGETHRQADSSADMSRTQSHESSKGRRALLLVEDNLINQKVLRRQLQSRGFEVFVASNGQEAIDAVEARGKNQDPSRNHFDCILMDQEMPIKDGNAATAEIRDLQKEGKAGRSPILGVSANVRQAQTDAMLSAGMDRIISKPYKVDDLVEKIQDLFPKQQ